MLHPTIIKPERVEPYRVSFNIAEPSANAKGLALLSRVDDVVREWLSRRSQSPQLDAEVGSWAATNYDLSIEGDDIGDAGYRYFQWECDDNRAPGNWLRLDVQLATEGDQVAFSLESYFLEQDDEDPPSLVTGPPTIVHELFDRFDCSFSDESLGAEVARITPETVAEYLNNRILAPHRRLPVVAVSQDTRGNSPVDPARFQQFLAGIASVAAYDHRTAYQIKDLVPSLSCYNGAVRVYWPSCTVEDVPKRNSNDWMPSDIKELDKSRFLRQLQGECLRCLGPAFDRQMFEDVRWRVQREAMEELREKEAQEQPQDWDAEAVERIAEQEQTISHLNRRLKAEQEAQEQLQQQNSRAAAQIAEQGQTIADLKERASEKDAENRRLRLEQAEQERHNEPVAGAAAKIAEQAQTIADLRERISQRDAENRRLRLENVEQERLNKQSDANSDRIIGQLEQTIRELNQQAGETGAEIRRLRLNHENEYQRGRLTNNERVGKGLWELKAGLAPFVSRKFISHYQGQAKLELQDIVRDDNAWQEILREAQDSSRPFSGIDVYVLLKVMRDRWHRVFRQTLSPAEETLVKDLLGYRNQWAHQRAFSDQAAYRALNSAYQLLSAVGASQTSELDELRLDQYEVSGGWNGRMAA